MDVFIPFNTRDPKSRLGEVCSREERVALAEAMLMDVLAAVEATEHTPYVLANAPVDLDATVIVDERSLSDAVNAMLELHDPPVSVIMADLPLVDAPTVERLTTTGGDVVLAPGVGGGTNAIVVRDRAFETDFHGCSIRDHATIAEAAGLDVTYVDSYRLGLDIDEVGDLVEVLLHAEGAATRWLRAHGFHVEADATGRVTIGRDARV
ncbi:MAG: 2-phospho-L-lactate guanylyltransferase [Halobacteriota archaeon]